MKLRSLPFCLNVQQADRFLSPSWSCLGKVDSDYSFDITRGFRMTSYGYYASGAANGEHNITVKNQARQLRNGFSNNAKNCIKNYLQTFGFSGWL